MPSRSLALSVGLPLALLAVATAALGSVGRGDTGGASPRARAAQEVAVFESRPDLRVPPVRVSRRAAGLAPGSIFVAPKRTRGRGTGALIVDDAGEPVWFRPDDAGERTNDFRVQEYRGRPVLTWWEGRALGGYGEGEGVIADTSYRVIKRVRAKRPYMLDMHEFKLTPRGSALVIVYHATRRDLRSVGGPRRGRVMDNIIQEIDVASGRVLFSWHSLGKIGLKESYRKLSEDRGQPWDYFHANSVDVDDRGDYIVSARYSNSVTKISRRTGRVVWRLGGKRSDFRMGRGTRFSLAHDARWQPDGTLRVFDNSEKRVRDRSRVITLSVDTKRKRITLAGDVRHTTPVLAATQANAQRLPNGNTFVGWGSQGRHSEFAPDGALLYDAELAPGYSSYRAYRGVWEGRPRSRPRIAAERRSDGTTAVYASWNGATHVAAWRVLAGASSAVLVPAAESPRQGFETRVRVAGHPARAAVQALDAAGAVLSTSAAITVRGG